jgi:hypothetical protein
MMARAARRVTSIRTVPALILRHSTIDGRSKVRHHREVFHGRDVCRLDAVAESKVEIHLAAVCSAIDRSRQHSAP